MWSFCGRRGLTSSRFNLSNEDFRRGRAGGPLPSWGEIDGEVLLVRLLDEKSEEDDEPRFRWGGPECIGILLVELPLGVSCLLRGCGAGTSSVGRLVDLVEEPEGGARDREVWYGVGPCGL